MAGLHPAPPFDELTYYPSSRRIRGTRGDKTILDSSRAVFVWGPGKMVPVYAFPRDDLALGRPGDWEALGVHELSGTELAGYVTVPWDALEHWYEENEEVFIHPRDPFVRIDVLPSTRHVRVERDGKRLADSDAPLLLFETGLPVRYYLPEADVNASLLAESDHHTGCPYKGIASYRDVVIDGRRHPNLFWFYPEPFSEVAAVKGYLAPYGERVDLIVDGELQERPSGPLVRQTDPAKGVA